MIFNACFAAPDSWKRLSINDVCEKITSGGTPSRKHSEYFENGTVGWLKTKELNDDIIFSSEELITDTAVANSSAKLLPKGTILLAMYGATVGMLAILGKDMACNQACCALIPKQRFDRDYLFYQLLAHRNQVQSQAIGAAQQNLSGQQIKNFIFPFPEEKEQVNIGSILRSLDDRIALLRETNATLEAIAQALFKSWFIDFDPVKAKQQGQDPQGMDAATASLFPDRFEESELGLVPNGWRVCSVYDLAQYINGAAYRAFEPNSEQKGLPIIKISELKAGVTSQTGFSEINMPLKYKINTKDILFSWSGNPDTSIDVFVWPHSDAWLNQHIFRVVPNAEQERSFVLLTLKYLMPVFAEIARNKQTTGLGHVTVADLKRLKAVRPCNILLEKWNELVDPLIEQAFIVEQKAQTLVSIRDSMLPRLISGQLRVSDANIETVSKAFLPIEFSSDDLDLSNDELDVEAHL